MIGGILPNNDLCIFLTDDNVKKLDSQTIKGTLIKLKEKSRIPLELKKDEEKSNYGINAEEEYVYRVFIFPRYYSELVKNGYMGTRNPLGWGIKIVEEDYASRDLLLESELQLLKKIGKSR
ncbi:MAG: hypothetical protein KKB25_00375 [Nanoarchaeota archaeon]|nr:hypothetical protein [Nanoarchaeota archaeon]